MVYGFKNHHHFVMEEKMFIRPDRRNFTTFSLSFSVWSFNMPGKVSILTSASVVGLLAAGFIYANLPTSWTIPYQEPTPDYLSEATLYKLHTGDADEPYDPRNPIQGSKILYNNQGPVVVLVIRQAACIFCRKEAQDLSAALKPLLQGSGGRLVGVVHEPLGAREFSQFFDGDLYFDENKTFFGPKQRWMPGWMGGMRLTSLLRLLQSMHLPGHFEGEGALMGGLYVLDRHGEMKYCHLEMYWGDWVDVEQVKTIIEDLVETK